MSETMAVLSSLTMLIVVFIYIVQVVRGSSTPNPATWFIWLVVMSMNTVTYYFVSGGNVWPILTPTTITFGMLVILVYSATKGRLGTVGKVEWISFLLAMFVGFLWKTTGSNIISNLAMQVVLLIGFIPTITGLVRDQLKEKPLSWLTAVTSYIFLIASILLKTDWTWAQLAFPVFNGIIGNGSVALAAIWQSSRSKRSLITAA